MPATALAKTVKCYGGYLFIPRDVNFTPLILRKAILVVGSKGSGKSALLEAIAYPFVVDVGYAKYRVLDLMDAGDHENFGWLRLSTVATGRVNALILTSQRVTLNWTKPKPPRVDVKTFDDFDEGDLIDYKLIILAGPPFCTPEERLQAITKILKVIANRKNAKNPLILLLREAHKILSLRGSKKGKAAARAELTETILEARHRNATLLLDLQCDAYLDPTFLNTCDVFIFKRVPPVYLNKIINSGSRLQLLLESAMLYLLTKGIMPHLFFTMMPEQAFFFISQQKMFIGTYKLVSFHKEEDEDLLDELGIEPMEIEEEEEEEEV